MKEKEVIPNIYVDVDGVLLTNYEQPAPYAKEFLSYILANYPDTTYWLTAHCDGDASTPIRDIGYLFDKETIELMKKIKPTKWVTAKTEAIDFSKPFIWFDDICFYFEQAEMKKHGVLKNWVKVDLVEYPNQLRDFIFDFPKPYVKK
jgi:hypothetical protein